jgi:hypothetical protein
MACVECERKGIKVFNSFPQDWGPEANPYKSINKFNKLNKFSIFNTAGDFIGSGIKWQEATQKLI